MTWPQPFQFTPASWRVLAEASRWTADAKTLLDLPQVLLALAAETECRAALLLSERGVAVDDIRRRWPGLDRRTAELDPRAIPWSAALREALVEAQTRLIDDESHLGLATEHLLLGILAGHHEAAAWLAERGLAADAVESEIHRRYGHQPTDNGTAIAWDEQEAVPPMVPVPTGNCREGPLPAPPSAASAETRPTQLPSAGLLRAFDAAANRASEGLRVAEDYVRFVLDDAHLTAALKCLRHDLGSTLARVPSAWRLAGRETLADVGTGLETPSEAVRADAGSIVAANFKRAQEAFRSLEEFGKTIDRPLAAAMKQLRYRAYTLERAAATTADSLSRLADARLYVLLDGRASLADFDQLTRSLVVAGVDVIQLRDKRLGDRELLTRARALRAATRGTRTLCVVNDRPDLAALAEADGVHLGQEEISAKDARAVVGPAALIGVSTHSLAQARQAVLDGASYLGVGPTFPSRTKEFARFPGTRLVSEVAAEIRLPAFAIGGIDRSNVHEVLAAGGTRIAVGGAVVDAPEPAAAATELLQILHRGA